MFYDFVTASLTRLFIARAKAFCMIVVMRVLRNSYLYGYLIPVFAKCMQLRDTSVRPSLDSHALRKIARFVHIRTLGASRVIGQQLQRHHMQQR